jgi:amino acid permease
MQVIISALITLPFNFRKYLSKVKVLSYLFTVILLMVLLAIVQECINTPQEKVSANLSNYMQPQPTLKIFGAISIVTMAITDQFFMFPVYAQMQTQAQGYFAHAIALKSLIIAAVITVVAISAIGVFGDELKSDLLINMG